VRRLVASVAVLGLGLLATAPVAGAQSPADLCSAAKAGTQCQPGNNRQTAGGGDKASHEGWPAISGVFWKVLDGDHLFVGGALSDELLGHHGSDVIRGGPGADVIWGDWDPVGNGPAQRDQLSGGSGNDWIYTSHGTNTVRGGSGDDVIWAFYGKGTVDCGPGYDRVRKRYSNTYRFKNCEATLG